MVQWKKKISIGVSTSVLVTSLWSGISVGGHNVASAADQSEQVSDTVVQQQMHPNVVSTNVLRQTVSQNVYTVMPINEVRTQSLGDTVSTHGVITYREETGSGYSNLYLQDGTAGLVIRGQNLPGTEGQEIEVRGKLTAYKALLQIEASASAVNITNASIQLPAPQTVVGTDFVTGNTYEAQLISVPNVTIVSKSGSNYTVKDATGTFIIYTANPWLEVGEVYTRITGVMSRYNNTFELIPRSTADIEGGTPPVIQPPLQLRIHDIQGAAQRSPYEGKEVQQVEGIVTMVKGKTSFYLQELDDHVDTNEGTSEGILVYRSAHGLKVGDKVSVDGSIKEYQELGYADAADLTTTEIVASAIRLQASNQPLPAPIILGQQGRSIPNQIAASNGLTAYDPTQYSIDFYESLEGMRIQLNDASIIGPYTYEIPVTVDLKSSPLVTPAGGLVIDNNQWNAKRLLISAKPTQTVSTGDQFAGALNGIMSYSYSNFKVLPEGALPPVIDNGLQREVSTLQSGSKQLTIASFNVENFWNNPKDQEKTARIADDVVNHLRNPDILGLMEVQDNNGETNDGTTDASQSFGALIKDIQLAGGPTYQYASISPQDQQDGGAPGGNIRVGFLYNPERVSLPVASNGAGNSVTAATYTANGLNYNPGRIAPTDEAFASSRKSLAAQFVFNGEQVIVIANHFNSKGGDQALYGSIQPPVRSSEIQRAKQASLLNQFVKQTLAQNSQANIVLLGDFNDFQFSNTLDVLKGKELTNLVDTLPANERYSYVYEGNSQTLDHILMTSKIANRAQLDIVHINSDFMEADGRVSDHDPLLARIDFGKKDSDKDDKTRPGSDNSSGNNSGGSGTTNPSTDNPTLPTILTAPEYEGLSTNRAIASWTMPTTVNTNTNNTVVASTTLTATMLNDMLNRIDGANTLRLSLKGDQSATTYQLQWEAAVQQSLTTQTTIDQIILSTPIGTYELPVSMIEQQTLAPNEKFILDLSNASPAVNQAKQAGYDVRTAVDFDGYILDGQNNKRSIQSFDQYIKRSIISSNVNAANRLAVVRAESAVNGNISYTPVPFTIANGEVTIYSRSNSTYLILNRSESLLKDISGHWAQADIQSFVDRMIVTGTGHNQFEPARMVTRAELATLLTRTLGLSQMNISTSQTPFTDVKSTAWYSDSVNTAVKAGLMLGDAKGTFRPQSAVTREELAVILERTLSFISQSPVEPSSNPVIAFKDRDQASSWSRSAIQRISNEGILKGNPSQQFQPKGNLTRADSIVALSRILQKINRDK
ncbi:S-layer homology domain-containing protein [Paenibacillus nuruki]|uniref:S-layer homology domain-containing protein n=1 Tax=Paenibacillus nuruki TaxID=1886670 RepID=UPI002803C288|nr:S-layer homology domain-containing protein [Paenibacillus nuruki]CAJ1316433.1 Endonuclease [Paenibacillus nuruki]